jgi:hypothetical protein
MAFKETSIVFTVQQVYNFVVATSWNAAANDVSERQATIRSNITLCHRSFLVFWPRRCRQNERQKIAPWVVDVL